MKNPFSTTKQSFHWQQLELHVKVERPKFFDRFGSNRRRKHPGTVRGLRKVPATGFPAPSRAGIDPAPAKIEPPVLAVDPKQMMLSTISTNYTILLYRVGFLTIKDERDWPWRTKDGLRKVSKRRKSWKADFESSFFQIVEPKTNWSLVVYTLGFEPPTSNLEAGTAFRRAGRKTLAENYHAQAC